MARRTWRGLVRRALATARCFWGAEVEGWVHKETVVHSMRGASQLAGRRKWGLVLMSPAPPGTGGRWPRGEVRQRSQPAWPAGSGGLPTEREPRTATKAEAEPSWSARACRLLATTIAYLPRGAPTTPRGSTAFKGELARRLGSARTASVHPDLLTSVTCDDRQFARLPAKTLPWRLESSSLGGKNDALGRRAPAILPESGHPRPVTT